MLAPRKDILPAAQRELWPRLAQVPRHFVLYGGTAIALRLGHRDSLDFDFFSDVELGEEQKRKLLTEIPWLKDASILQNERNTLTVSIATGLGPIKLSFFGGIETGCVAEPDRTDDDVACVASLDDLLAHKLKVIHDRAEGKDYQDIAAMIESGESLARGLACRDALFGAAVPTMVTLKALAYFTDVNEPWRITESMKATIRKAINQLPDNLGVANIYSYTLNCARDDAREPK
jgi:hypothetical protein